MPSVSVIVPLYNKESTVARTLESVFAQEYRDYEVIVVDDGSTDGSVAVVRALDHPVRLVSQVNSGPGAARNLGVRLGNGEFVAFIDADDEWSPEYLARMVATLRANEDLACASCGYLEYPSGNDLSNYWRSRGLRDGIVQVADERDASRVLVLLRYMQTLTTIVRRSRFIALGGFYDGSRCLYAEDTHLYLKLLLTGRVHLTLAPLGRYHREDSQLSDSSAGPRPIEPFLTDPADVRAFCPSHLTSLLDRVLEARANKTACMLGYWGRWREAREIRTRFSRGGLLAPLALPAMLAGTPLAGVAGSATRLSRAAWGS